MSFQTTEVDAERRKQVRLRARRDLIITAQTYEGVTYHAVKDPIGLRYFRLDVHERWE